MPSCIASHTRGLRSVLRNCLIKMPFNIQIHYSPHLQYLQHNYRYHLIVMGWPVSQAYKT